MSDLTSALEVVLQEGGYRTSLVSVEGILAGSLRYESSSGSRAPVRAARRICTGINCCFCSSEL